MDELEKVRGQALGKKADPAYLEKFPIKGCEELMIPTRGGNALVHLYRPQALTSPLPAVINFHGGGFVKGYRGRDIEFSQMIASRGTYLVFDVDYKVAPEYPYPCALEEGEDVVTYLLAHMADYDGDREPYGTHGGKLRRKPCHRNFLETEKNNGASAELRHLLLSTL